MACQPRYLFFHHQPVQSAAGGAISLFQGGAGSFENAGAASVRGVDADLPWQGFSKAWTVWDGTLEVGGDLYRNSGFDDAASGAPRFAQASHTR